MTELKMQCPVCGSITSSVGLAVRDGQPCPHCGASSATIREIRATRSRLANAELKQRIEELLVEREREQAELKALRAFRNSVHLALLEVEPR